MKVGSIGTVFESTIRDETGSVVNISAATTKTLTFQKPSGRVVVKPAVLVNSGTDGKMKYTTVAGDLDESGEWRVEGRVAVGGGDWPSDEVLVFYVKPTLG